MECQCGAFGGHHVARGQSQPNPSKTGFREKLKITMGELDVKAQNKRVLSLSDYDATMPSLQLNTHSSQGLQNCFGI